MILEAIGCAIVGGLFGAFVVLTPVVVASRRRYRRARRAFVEQCDEWERYRARARARGY